MQVKTSIYLDRRYTNSEGKMQVKIALRRNYKSAYILTGIHVFPDEWDGSKIVGNSHRTRVLNEALAHKKSDVDLAVIELGNSGAFLKKDINEIQNLVMARIDPEFFEANEEKQKVVFARENGIAARFARYIDNKKNEGTKSVYCTTLKKIREYCDSTGSDISTLLFEDVNRQWLEAFEAYCLKTERQNTVAIHLRNIRAVFNAAIDDEITTFYPFRKFRIRREETRDKSFTAAELRELFNFKCYPGGEQESVDIFMLMFCLIGINAVDLSNLRFPVKGRVEYYRAKTHKLYSIKVEPEAQRIIKKYKGQKHALNIIERCPNYKTYFNRMGKSLRKVGKKRVSGSKSLGNAILPDICTGSARTSWATIAQSELDIPRDVIAAALGHHTIDVTTTYLRTAWEKKIDEANRRVLDWVFYGKK